MFVVFLCAETDGAVRAELLIEPISLNGLFPSLDRHFQMILVEEIAVLVIDDISVRWRYGVIDAHFIPRYMGRRFQIGNR